MSSTTLLLLRIFLVGSVIVGLIVLGVFLVPRLRRAAKTDTPASVAFTLEDLRELQRSGQISEREFETVRAMMLARLKDDRAEETSEY